MPRKKASRRSWRALEKKEKGEIKKLAVFGCLIQRYYKELKSTFSQADIVWGVNDIEELADAIAAARPGDYPDRKPFSLFRQAPAPDLHDDQFIFYQDLGRL